MSSSASQQINQENKEGGNMDWLARFLKRTFFGTCSVHQNEANNELNKFCITCEEPECKHCIASGSHEENQLLKIHKHVYKDVVLLDQMEAHIDCTKIQPYKCNKKLVISLNPLPHCGSGEANKDGSCLVCMRKLTQNKTDSQKPEQYYYCCIACKFQVTNNSNDSEGDVSEAVPKEDQDVCEAVPEEAQDVSVVVPEEDPGTQNKRKQKRKGKPCKAAV